MRGGGGGGGGGRRGVVTYIHYIHPPLDYIDTGAIRTSDCGTEVNEVQ